MNGPVLDRRCLRIPSLRLHNVKERKNFRPSVSPEPRHRAFRTAPVQSGGRLISRRPARRQLLFLRRRGFHRTVRRSKSPPPIFLTAPLPAGSAFYLRARRSVNLFFCAEAFFTSASRAIVLCFTSHHFAEYFGSTARRGFYPRAATPSTAFFEDREVSFSTPSAKPSLPPRPHRPDHSVRWGGRFLRPSPAPVKPFFFRSSLFSKIGMPPFRQRISGASPWGSSASL